MIIVMCFTVAQMACAVMAGLVLGVMITAGVVYKATEDRYA